MITPTAVEEPAEQSNLSMKEEVGVGYQDKKKVGKLQWEDGDEDLERKESLSSDTCL